MLSKRTSILLYLAMTCLSTSRALTCESDQLKITIKTDPDEYEFDDHEKYLLQGTVAYSVRKFCANGTDVDPTPYTDCNKSDVPTLDTIDVDVSNQTARIAMCVKVKSVSTDTVRISIKRSKANLNGALLLTDDVLFVDGIEPTLEPEYDPDFDTWLIPYIVICCLVILAGIAMILYSHFHKDDEEDGDKVAILEEDKESRIEHIQDNNGYSPDTPTLTML